MTSLYIMRHGESKANAARIVAGHLDTPLTERGRQQARRAGQAAREDNLAINVIVSSPLPRARETAEIVAREVGLSERDIILDQLLIERNCGQFEGGPLEDYFAVSEADAEARGVESLESLERRAQLLLTKLERSHPNQTILLVSHNGIIKTLQLVANHRPNSDHQRDQMVPNAEIVPLLAQPNR